jgi:nucleoside-diphosphate-sugar epimerase
VNGDDELVAADVTDRDALRAAVKGSDIVYCTIGFAYSTKVWRATWPEFMRNLTEACLEFGARLVFFDNVYMYAPEAIPHMTEQSPIGPVSNKGKVRKEVTDIIEAAGKAGMPWIIARSADFYGPGNRQSVLVETVWKNMQAGKTAQWLGSADKLHNFTNTPDAAKATALLGNSADTWNRVWHLPTSKERMTGRDWVKLFADISGRKNKVMVAPVWLVSMMGLFVPIMKEIKEMLYQNTQDYLFISDAFMERFPDFRITTPQEVVSATIADASSGG